MVSREKPAMIRIAVSAAAYQALAAGRPADSLL